MSDLPILASAEPGTCGVCLVAQAALAGDFRCRGGVRGNSRLAYGKIIIPGHIAALRRAAGICAGGYQPGTIERGVLDGFARGTPEEDDAT